MPRKRYQKNKSKMIGIYLENFQSIRRPTYLNCQGLTFLYGPNSAGKSSVIDALKLLHHASDPLNKWYLDRKLEKEKPIQNGQNSVPTVIGLDYLQGDTWDIATDTQKLWSTRSTGTDWADEAHVDFHTKLKGKVIGIRFVDFSGMSVVVDGSELFTIRPSDVIIDVTHKLTSNIKKSHDTLYLNAEIRINKKHPCIKLLNIPIDLFSKELGDVDDDLSRSYHWPLFINETAEYLTVRGLSMDLAYVQKITTDYNIDDILFYEYPQKGLRGISKSERDFLREHFYQRSSSFKKLRDARRNLFWKLEELAKFLDLLIQGFLLHIGDAIEIAHCQGDRQLLSSSTPFYVAPSDELNLKVEACQDAILSRFAESKLGWVFPTPTLREDFVERCFREHLKGLKDYKVVAEIRKIFALPKLAPESAENSITTKALRFASGILAPNTKIKEQLTTDEIDRKYEKGKIVYLRVKRPDGGISGFEDVGSGISFILPVLTSLWAGRLAVIEQPELHLHPALQCDLGDVFIAAYRGGSAAIVESHSEHILLRILRRIRETTKGKAPRSLALKATDVTIYYFEPVRGETIVKEIHVDRHGELLDRWPGGFFAERDLELFS